MIHRLCFGAPSAKWLPPLTNEVGFYSRKKAFLIQWDDPKISFWSMIVSTMITPPFLCWTTFVTIRWSFHFWASRTWVTSVDKKLLVQPHLATLNGTKLRNRRSGLPLQRGAALEYIFILAAMFYLTVRFLLKRLQHHCDQNALLI